MNPQIVSITIHYWIINTGSSKYSSSSTILPAIKIKAAKALSRGYQIIADYSIVDFIVEVELSAQNYWKD
jgi:hypothetical protein